MHKNIEKWSKTESIWRYSFKDKYLVVFGDTVLSNYDVAWPRNLQQEKQLKAIKFLFVVDWKVKIY